MTGKEAGFVTFFRRSGCHSTVHQETLLTKYELSYIDDK
jgi:hypothetical protein